MNIENIFEYLGIEFEEQERLSNDATFIEEVTYVHEFASDNDMEYCLRGDEFRFEPTVIIEVMEEFVIYV